MSCSRNDKPRTSELPVVDVDNAVCPAGDGSSKPTVSTQGGVGIQSFCLLVCQLRIYSE